MRSCRKNKQKVYYANLLGIKPKLNGLGHPTGSFENIYSPIKELDINIKSSNSKYAIDHFGLFAQCHLILVKVENYKTFVERTGISSTSIFWVNQDINKEHNYRVEVIGTSLNTVRIGLVTSPTNEKVEVIK